MRTFALLLVLSLALGSSPAVHAARPKFLQPEFYGSIARQLITQLEVDYGLTPEQAEVVQALYGDVTAPEAEEAIQVRASAGMSRRSGPSGRAWRVRACTGPW